MKDTHRTRLRRALNALAAQGFITAVPVPCCTVCSVERWEARGTQRAVFCEPWHLECAFGRPGVRTSHLQDPLTLCFYMADCDDRAEVGQAIVAALRDAGLDVEWDVNLRVPIQVLPA